ncbi:MAG: alpha/beta fold hydrolase [Deltaproteobacteria bacterium]|nr:alpha/beta fold hydrolase [Deltaproteobacteria bacterium]MBW2293838.1 alpha/beta fold hydrolase [Deltaproteobacteria bacterium]MBW2388258.1 alpha/beta fold hydrolase [Deltaproteobacteria bacterium]MBW2723928.1 alpha/beta fold hydrolase [Deltaproteobacteria bacterium]
MTLTPQDVDATAFDLMPDAFDGRASALCLHGLTGTPYEMRPIAEELVRRGLRCVGPVMAGHGQTPVELRPTPYRAWVDLARDSLLKLRGESERVYVVGLSMGGLVTLALAAENCADAVAVLGTPLRFAASVRLRVPLAKYVYPYMKKNGDIDIQDEEARARHPGLDAIPLASAHQAMKLQKLLRARLPKITAPIFIGHGALDRTANPRDARAIFAAVNSDERILYICKRSGHVISVDHDGPALATAIADFVQRQIECA